MRTEALLPDDLRNFDGYRLLQEYFAFPARFRFISLSGLGKLIQRCEDEKAFDIFILLDKSDDQLERVVDASHPGAALHAGDQPVPESGGPAEAERKPA